MVKSLPLAEHRCRCQKDWSGIKFTRASLLSDGRLELAHACESHAGEQCVHVLGAHTAGLIRKAFATS